MLVDHVTARDVVDVGRKRLARLAIMSEALSARQVISLFTKGPTGPFLASDP